MVKWCGGGVHAIFFFRCFQFRSSSYFLDRIVIAFASKPTNRLYGIVVVAAAALDSMFFQQPHNNIKCVCVCAVVFVF